MTFDFAAFNFVFEDLDLDFILTSYSKEFCCCIFRLLLHSFAIDFNTEHSPLHNNFLSFLSFLTTPTKKAALFDSSFTHSFCTTLHLTRPFFNESAIFR